MNISPAVLDLVMDEHIPGNSLKKQFIKKKIRKLHKQGRLTDGFMARPGKNQQDWAFRIFSANTLLGDYSWWGWECRSDWAWDLANKKWFYPKWNGKPCKLLVLAEQGLGDEIMFASCYEELHRDCPDLTIEMAPRLLPIMRRSFPGIKFVSRENEEPDQNGRIAKQLTDYRGDFDAFIPAGSVASIYRRKIADFPKKPYLKPIKIEPTDKIGYVHVAGVDNEKYVDPDGLGDVDLHHIHGVQFEDFEHYISYVDSLKGVNCVPSALVHLCGAIGQKCTVIRPGLNSKTALRWYYPKDREMDWYPIKILRNKREFYDHSPDR